MVKKIYKYVGPGNLEKVFSLPESATFKCSYPKDFNDPYELFLTVDFNQRPDIVAFYSEAVGSLPQLPTTCFSLSPCVVPMWAHYAQNSEGFAVEFDEDKLGAACPDSKFADVEYRNTPHEALTEMLYRASEIGKPRYVYFLQNWVFKSAYFTKTTCWEYEQERRMVVGRSEIRRAGDLLLLDVPRESVTALICGPRASKETIAALQAKSAEIGCDYYQLRIGRSSASPFLLDTAGSAFEFDGAGIKRCSHYCNSCQEPLSGNMTKCSWCQIDESHRRAAALRNPYRMFHHAGMLDSYIEGMNKIGREWKKR